MNPRTSWDNVDKTPRQSYAERLVFALILALTPVAIVAAAALILHALKV